MYFQWLRARLVDKLQERVRSGELTERYLAIATGISQPHIHNVVKGVRALSMEAADRIMQCLGITLAELSAGAPAPYVLVPVLEGRLGPGHRFPWEPDPGKFYPFLSADIAPLSRPVVARLAEDAAMRPLWGAEDVALLDRAEEPRQAPKTAAYYAIDLGHSGLIRGVRRGSRGLYLVPQGGTPQAGAGDYLSLQDRNILDVVKARVVWFGHYMEPLVTRPTQEAG